MPLETRLDPSSPRAEHHSPDTVVAQAATAPDLRAPLAPLPVRPPTPWHARPLVWLAAAVAILLLAGAGVWLLLYLAGGLATPGQAANETDDWPSEEEVAVVTVNTIRPHRKDLVRTLEQPGSIRPWAQAELYAKASGNLKSIRRELTPRLSAELAAHEFSAALASPLAPPLAGAVYLATAAEMAYLQAPPIDIGSFVWAGDLLLTIDVPELFQDVVQKESTWKQRVAELEEARTAIATYEAAVQAAEAQKKQAEADVKKALFDYEAHQLTLKRVTELVSRGTIQPERKDEEMHSTQAAEAAVESSRAKVLAVQAEQAVVASKLATARSELQVKEAQANVAHKDLERAKILAEYAFIRAPFDGVVTERPVDEGDFIQNATTGQTRSVLTVTAIDKVKVVLQVPEREALWVRPGTEAAVHVDARTRWQVKGRVSRISYALDNQSRTMRVEIDLDNADRKLMPGMYGQVTLVLQKIPNAMAIPSQAVYSRGDETYVLQVEGGVVHRHRVRINYDDGHEVEVVKLIGDQEVPLDGSEELVVSNKRELHDGQQVKTAPLHSH
jgi:RND family efflux transporter MFP subunit